MEFVSWEDFNTPTPRPKQKESQEMVSWEDFSGFKTQSIQPTPASGQELTSRITPTPTPKPSVSELIESEQPQELSQKPSRNLVPKITEDGRVVMVESEPVFKEATSLRAYKPNLLERIVGFDNAQKISNLSQAIPRGISASILQAGSGLTQVGKVTDQLRKKYIDEPLGIPDPNRAERERFYSKIQQVLEGKAQKQTKAVEMQPFNEAGIGLFRTAQIVPPMAAALAGQTAGIPAPLTFGTIAGGQYAREAEIEGATPEQQLAYGTIMGIVEGLTEKIPLGTLNKIYGSAGKKALLSYLKNISEEGIQEAVSQIASSLTKQVVYKPDEFITNGKIDWKKVRKVGEESLESGGQGMLGAALLGGPGTVIGGINTMRNRQNVPTDISPTVAQEVQTETPVQQVQEVQQEVPLQQVQKIQDVQPEPVIQPEKSQGTVSPINDMLNQKVTDMTKDEIKQSIYTHELTGLWNKRVYQQVTAEDSPLRKPIQVAIDGDGTKWFNDNYGHSVGDKVIKTWGEAFKSLGIDDVFHLSGDEFAAQFNTEEEAHAAMKKIDDFLKRVTIEVEVGDEIHRIKGGSISYAIGSTYDIADRQLKSVKQTKKGDSSPDSRGVKPVSISQTIERRRGDSDRRKSPDTNRLTEPTQEEQGPVSSLRRETIPIDERNYENVGSPKVKSFQFEHPEVKDFIQAEAVRIIGELNDPVFTKGQRFYTKSEDGTVNTGIPKNVSPTIQRIQDATKASYAEIEQALQDIVRNRSAENYSLAKKIELIIDDNLTQGVTDIRGQEILPDEEYIAQKQAILSRKTSPSVEDSNIRSKPQGEIPPERSSTMAGIRSRQNSDSQISAMDERSEPTETETRIGKYTKGRGPKLGIVADNVFRPSSKARLNKTFDYSDPVMESEFRKSHGIKKPTIIQKMMDFAINLKNKATREFEHLPKTAEFAQLRSDLLKLAKQKNVSSHQAIESLRAQLIRLNPEEYGLMERAVLINDLYKESQKENPSLPPGFTPENIAKEKAIKDQQVAANKLVKEAIEIRNRVNREIWEERRKAFEAIGKNPGEFNEEYFHHQVLEYANIKGLIGTGKRLKTPYRGFEKRRSGYQGSINTNYLEAEYEVLSQMIEDTQIAKTIKSVQDNYDISETVKAQAKQAGADNWHAFIPEGYVTWQPREGNAFYMVDSIPAKLAAQLNDDIVQEIGITKDDLRKALAMGGLRKEFVVKKEVADTLDNLVKPKEDGTLKAWRKSITAAWKVNALFNPRRLIKYNFRNITSDGEWTMLGNPRAFKRTPQVAKELFNVIFKNEPMTPELREWFQRGGMESTLFIQELGDINKLKVFEHLFKKYPDIKKIPQNLWERYWKFAGVTSQYREAILRYSNYLEYLDQIKSDPEGKPKNFGASVPEEVMAIKDIRDRAFWLANDLSGAYDKVSTLGQEIRSQLIPFWSYQEVNFKRYIQYMKNQARDGMLPMAIGRHFIKNSPRIALNIGKTVLKMTSFWAALQIYNNTLFGDEEKDLPPEVQGRPHIIFGRDKDGKVKYFDRLGALGDFLEWFGLDAVPQDISDFLNGRRTIGEIARDMIKSPLNKFVNGVSPLYKLPFELITKKQLYPDVTKPSRIRDIGVYLARQVGLENEYKIAMGLPTRGFLNTTENAFLYSVDPREAAYFAILDEKQRFKKKVGSYQEGYSESARSNALYNLKMAMRYKDKRAIDKYLKEYVILGGTEKGLSRSLDSLNPLYGLSKHKDQFIASLDEDQKHQLELAMQFYKDAIMGEKELIQRIRKMRTNRR